MYKWSFQWWNQPKEKIVLGRTFRLFKSMSAELLKHYYNFFLSVVERCSHFMTRQDLHLTVHWFWQVECFLQVSAVWQDYWMFNILLDNFTLVTWIIFTFYITVCLATYWSHLHALHFCDALSIINFIHQ